jgi:hypothetical protein
VEEPEYSNSVFRLEANGSLKPLERQRPSTVRKVKALGYGGATAASVIPGESSLVRFTAGDNLEFVVRVERRDIDPQTSLQFFTLKPEKGKRQLLIVKVGSIGISSKTTAGESPVAFEATKYGEFSFKVRPVSALPPGEYTISTRSSLDGFCFGIDQKQ